MAPDAWLPHRNLGLDDDLDSVLSSSQPAPPYPSDEASLSSSSSDADSSSIAKDRGRRRPPSIAVVPATPRAATAPPSFVMSSLPLSAADIDRARRVKYAEGRYAGVELVPQPTDYPGDPLNWPRWRKSLHLYVLVFASCVGNFAKSVMLPINAHVADSLRVSAAPIAALTAVPLVLGAFSGVAASAVARAWGKWTPYLVASIFLQLGLNLNAMDGAQTSYGFFMGARILQGLGWGVFDALLYSSIQDTYFEHELPRLTIYMHFYNIASLLGAPALLGVAARNAGSPAAPFTVISVFAILAETLIILGVPESAFDRSVPDGHRVRLDVDPSTVLAAARNHDSGSSSWPLRAVKRWARIAGAYQSTMRPDYRHPTPRLAMAQPVRALGAPTVVVLALATLLPQAALWGLAQTLSPSLRAEPFGLSPAAVGSIVTAAGALAVLFIVVYMLARVWLSRRRAQLKEAESPDDASEKQSTKSRCFSQLSLPPMLVAAVAAVGSTILVAAGVFGYGIYLHDALSKGRVPHLATLAFLLGLLATGVIVLSLNVVRPLVARSTRATCGSVASRARATVDMHAGITFWSSILAGIFVAASANAVAGIGAGGSLGVGLAGVRDFGLGIGVSHIALLVGCAMLWRAVEHLFQMWDSTVMGLVDASELKRSGSFFDWD